MPLLRVAITECTNRGGLSLIYIKDPQASTGRLNGGCRLV